MENFGNSGSLPRKPLPNSTRIRNEENKESQNQSTFKNNDQNTEIKNNTPFNSAFGIFSSNLSNSNAFENNANEHNMNYYHEYCRLFIANMKELVTEKNELTNKLMKLEKKTEDFKSMDSPSNEDDRRKRFRRTAGEIDRHFRCPVESCQKSYGSEGSLNQHIKLKHPEIFSEMMKNGNINMTLQNTSFDEKSSINQSLLNEKKNVNNKN